MDIQPSPEHAEILVARVESSGIGGHNGRLPQWPMLVIGLLRCPGSPSRSELESYRFGWRGSAGTHGWTHPLGAL
jgi:hypothetical protein